ncbi:hypothetical protein GCM10010336_14710 [Streptomyces goshikiensis]|nr:hypothetical protein GCM10010336_14710 [Streptomyces goshikiensis]
MCARHLEAQFWSAPSLGLPQWRLEPESVTIVVRTVQVIALYAELLSTDAYPAGFVPWNGRTAAAVVGAKPRGENAVPLVPDQLLQPLLATCPYLVEAVGPRLAEVVEARRAHEAARAKGPVARIADVPRLQGLCEEPRERAEPLPKITANQISRYPDRLGDPLRPLARGYLVSLAGFRKITDTAKPHLIHALLEVAEGVGFAGAWACDAPSIPPLRGRQASPVDRAGGCQRPAHRRGQHADRLCRGDLGALRDAVRTRPPVALPAERSHSAVVALERLRGTGGRLQVVVLRHRLCQLHGQSGSHGQESLVLRLEFLVLFLKRLVLPGEDPDGGGGQNAGAGLNRDPGFAKPTSGWPGTVLADANVARLARVLFSLAELVALIRARSALVMGHRTFLSARRMSLP